MIRLKDTDTEAPKDFDKKETKEKTEKYLEKLAELQDMLYAQARHSLLVIFQGLDASGKDGAVKNVFSGINPMGCSVKSWKKPTEEEMQYDYLWRIHPLVPKKGKIVIFNRSYYEDVIVPMVSGSLPEKQIRNRMVINRQFESLLREENNTTIIKFYLHISKKEQLERLKERETDPTKFWKHNPGDMKVHARYDEFLEVYDALLNHKETDTPWIVVPSDQNWYKEYLVAKTLVETMEDMKLEYPGKGK
jgi:PPK2 family polyphosphate:nucleotide phosphotransferase